MDWWEWGRAIRGIVTEARRVGSGRNTYLQITVALFLTRLSLCFLTSKMG